MATSDLQTSTHQGSGTQKQGWLGKGGWIPNQEERWAGPAAPRPAPLPLPRTRPRPPTVANPAAPRPRPTLQVPKLAIVPSLCGLHSRLSIHPCLGRSPTPRGAMPLLNFSSYHVPTNPKVQAMLHPAPCPLFPRRSGVRGSCALCRLIFTTLGPPRQVKQAAFTLNNRTVRELGRLLSVV